MACGQNPIVEETAPYVVNTGAMLRIDVISHVKDGAFIELTKGGIDVLMGPTVSIRHSTALNSEGRKAEYSKTYA